jgi:subtilisin-like proprotein convertase family protein
LPDYFLVSVPPGATVGRAFSVTVTAADSAGHAVADYVGTVHFTSSDPQVVLPADYTFAPADHGSHTFTVTFQTPGSQTLTVTDTAIPAGLVGWWAGEGNANDATGNHNGILQGGTSFAPGKVGQAFSLNGTGSYVDLGPGFNLDALTLDAWVFIDPTTNTGDRRVISKDNAGLGGTRKEFSLKSSTQFWSGHNGVPDFEVLIGNDITATDVVTAPSALSAGWHHLAGLRDTSAGRFELYVDGVLVASKTPTLRGAIDSNVNTNLGRVGPVNTEYFAGLIDEADIFSRALSAAEIQRIYAAGAAGRPKGAIGFATTTVAADHLLVSGPPGATVGMALSVTITAADPAGNTDAGYQGTVHFASSDNNATLPADYTFTAADHGMHTFSVTFASAGRQTLVATNTTAPAVTGTLSSPLPGLFATGADATGSLQTDGAVDPHYQLVASTGSALGRNLYVVTPTTFNPTLPQAVVGSLWLANGPNSEWLAPVPDGSTVPAPGLYTYQTSFDLTGIDPATVRLSGQWTTEAAGQEIDLNGSNTGVAPQGGITAMQPFTISSGFVAGVNTLQFKVAANNGFSESLGTFGTLHFNFTGLRVELTGTGAGITVKPAPTAALALSGIPASVTAGAGQSLTVTARDAAGNIATSYTGTVHFTSTDPLAVLPPDYTFTANDQGVHSFPITLETAGSQALTITDKAAPSLTATLSGIQVLSVASSFRVSGLSLSATSGVADPFTVTALDANGKAATGFRGTVHYASSDGQAILPGDYTFTAADAGVHTFQVTFRTAGSGFLGSKSLLIYTANALIFTTAVAVSPAAANTFQVTGLSSHIITAGVAQTCTVTAFDPYGNVATGYRGTVHFGTSDSLAALPADYTFTSLDQGRRTFSVTWQTVGGQSLTVADVNSRIAGFVSSPVTTLFDTGVDSAGALLLGGAVDLHYQLVANSYPSVPGPNAYVVNPRLPWAANGPTSQWVGPGAGRTSFGPFADYTYQTTFDLRGLDPSVAQISGQWMLDGGGLEIDLNGQNTGAAVMAGSLTGWQPFTITSGLVSGLNTLGFKVHQTGLAFSPADLRLELSATAGGVLVQPAPKSTFQVAFTGPGYSTAGTAQTFMVSALDPAGRAMTGYTGTVHFSSSDTRALLPADYTFTSADRGRHTFAVTLKTAGNQSVTAVDTTMASISGSSSITVTPAAASQLRLDGLSSTTTAGTVLGLQVTALDPYGNVVTGYQGTLLGISSDPQAEVPDALGLAASDQGTRSFAVTFRTAGSQSLTLADMSNSSLAVTGSLSVTPATASGLRVDGWPASATAGQAVPLTVRAVDLYGNVAGSYTGTIHFSSTDTAAQLPPDYSFVSGQGSQTFHPIFETAAGQTITVTDAANGFTTTTSTVQVNAAAASKLRFGLFSGLGPVTAGDAHALQVTALDQFGNIAGSYQGTIHLSSSDGQAIFAPNDYTFQTGDQGVHNFAVELKTAGVQTLTATDNSVPALTLTESNITVNAAAASVLQVVGPTSVVAGDSHLFTVTSQDSYGNTAPTYRGTVHFTSSDNQASLPNDYSFKSTDAGVKTFSVVLKTAGSQSVTTGDGTLSGTKAGITVSPAPATLWHLGGLPAGTSVGATIPFTLAAVDSYSNVATGFGGIVFLYSSDPLAQVLLPGAATATSLPAEVVFKDSDPDSKSFDLILKTPGNQTLYTVNGSSPSLTAAQQQIAVEMANTFRVQGFPATTTAGVAHSFTVTALDGSGNVVTGYSGTVHFSSSDQSAGLLADYTFTSSDNGQHTFTATLKTAGNQSLSATDTIAPSISGSESAISVQRGPATHFSLTGLPASAMAGTPLTVTVTALDAGNNIATGFLDQVDFSTNDSKAGLPRNYTFIASDNGVKDFTVTFGTAGSRYLSVGSGSLLSGQASLTITPAAASKLTISGSATANSGYHYSANVTALDQFGNTATGYTGTVAFQSSDSQATLPANYSFASGDMGTHTFDVPSKTAGAQTITVTDTGNSSLTATTSVQVLGTAANLQMIGLPASATAGLTQSFSIQAVDAIGNVSHGYRGTIHFTLSDSLGSLYDADAGASLPGNNYTFTLADQGVHEFKVYLATPGNQRLDVADTANPALTTGGSIAVAAGTAPVARFDWRMPAHFNQDNLTMHVDPQTDKITFTSGSDGLIDYPWEDTVHAVDYIYPSSWHVTLDASASVAGSTPIVAYQWTVPSNVPAPQPTGNAGVFTCDFPDQGSYPVTLTITSQDGQSNSFHLNVVVRDYLIVSLGDSYGSGEGSPDRTVYGSPTTPVQLMWEDIRTHRSHYAGAAQAALAIESADPHSSVTFISLAASGALLTNGILAPYEGTIPPPNELAPLAPQIDQMEILLRQHVPGVATRHPDAVLISIGGNDAGFASLVEDLALPVPLEKETADIQMHFLPAVQGLIDNYRNLDVLLHSDGVKNICITEYSDPTHDASGGFSDFTFPLSGITADKAAWAYQNLLVPLNATIQRDADLLGWHYVGGIDAQDLTHGISSGGNRWLDTLNDSYVNEFDWHGVVHPNYYGQFAIANSLVSSVHFASIQGQVFIDLNANGVKDRGEDQGLGGWTVYLDNNNDGTLDVGDLRTVTAADGSYILAGVAPGTHVVRLMPPADAGWDLDTISQTVTVADDGTVTALFPPPPPGAVPSDLSEGQGYTRVSDVPQPQGEGTVVNFGVYHQGSLSGLVFQDSNHNGTQDAGEPPLAGRTVFLDQLHNGTLTTNVASFGSTNVPVPITDADQATDVLSGDNPETTSSTLAVSDVRGLVAGVTLTLNITGNKPTENDMSVVLVSPLGQQADVFDNVSGGVLTKDLTDFNNDLANGTWTLQIIDNKYGSSGTLQSWSLDIKSGDPSLESDANGQYSFANLRPGSYRVREFLPTGWSETAPAAGYVDVTITSSQAASGLVFGEFPPTTVSILGSGPGQTVTLASSTGTGLTDAHTIANPSPANTPPNATFPAGIFDFKVQGLEPGGFATVTLTLPPGVPVNNYYQYGPTPDQPTPHWYSFLFDGTTGAVIIGNFITLHFQDSQRGDADLTVNGVIVDPRAPAFVPTANQRFVAQLYRDVLRREAEPGALTGWSSLLDQVVSRFAVAWDVEHSWEARTLQVQSWYVHYLGRAAEGGEEQGWVSLLLQGSGEEVVLSGILSSPEYLLRAGLGTPRAERFVEQLFEDVLGRTAAPAEVLLWTQAAQVQGRDVAAELVLNSWEARTRDVLSDYFTLLGRQSQPAEAEIDGWVFSPFDRTGMRAGLESSQEFVDRISGAPT